MEKEIIKRSLTAVKSAFDAFKKNYREGTPCGKLFDNFTVTLKSLLGDYQIKYDFLCGKDTVNIDGVTDRNYLPKKGDAIIIDASVKTGGLWCDVARTFFVGKASERQKKDYDLVLSSILRGEKVLRAEICAKEVYTAVNSIYTERGEKLVHHAGHGIGAKPLIAPQFLSGKEEKLKVDNFYTLESGIYNGSGIRLENDYFITESGCEKLFDYPLDIENFIIGDGKQ